MLILNKKRYPKNQTCYNVAYLLGLGKSIYPILSGAFNPPPLKNKSIIKKWTIKISILAWSFWTWSVTEADNDKIFG